MVGNLKKLAAVAVCAGAVAAPAHAALVTYTFSGVVQANVQEFEPLFSVGDAGQYVLTLDTATPDTCGPASPYGCYAGAVTFMSLSVGNVVLASSNAGDIVVGNDTGWWAQDLLQPYTTSGFNNAPVLGYVPYQVQGNTWSSSTLPFASKAIPTETFALDLFNLMNGVVADFTRQQGCTEAELYVVYGCYSVGDHPWAGGQFNMAFTGLVVTPGGVAPSPELQGGGSNPVPAPAPLAMAALGLVGLARLRRGQVAA